MPEEVGLAADAARAREALLTRAFSAASAADHALPAPVMRAFQSAIRGRAGLDVIAAEIDSAVANQQALALNTPAGALSFSRFLQVKTQDIKQVVAEAVADCTSDAAVLRSQRPCYPATAPSATAFGSPLLGGGFVPRGPITLCIQPGGTSGSWRCSVLYPDLHVRVYWSFTDDSGGSLP
ncbi:MAG: DUF4226 domain-containing protein [Mycobacterium sp.]|nr:DUF4226 domain-containing protein [Mycobacterium sp.]